MLVLGSATPSIENYHRALNGELELINLTKRALNTGLPVVEIVNMAEQLEMGNREIFSYELIDAIDKNLKNEKQIILFLNRRGYSSFVSCKSCGYVEKCSHCDIAMTFHKADVMLKCHYCGKT